MKVVEALFGYLIRKLVARRKERLVTLGEKDDLLLTGEMLLPHGWCDSSLAEVDGSSTV